jgi:hypothetical protein
MSTTVPPAGWSLLTASSGLTLHRLPLFVVGMLVLEFVGLIVLQRHQAHVQAQCQRSVLELVRVMPGVKVVTAYADGSFEIRSDNTDGPQNGKP